MFANSNCVCDEAVYIKSALKISIIWPQNRLYVGEIEGRSSQPCQFLDRIVSIRTRNRFKSYIDRSLSIPAKFSLVRDHHLVQTVAN